MEEDVLDTEGGNNDNAFVELQKLPPVSICKYGLWKVEDEILNIIYKAVWRFSLYTAVNINAVRQESSCSFLFCVLELLLSFCWLYLLSVFIDQ